MGYRATDAEAKQLLANLKQSPERLRQAKLTPPGARVKRPPTTREIVATFRAELTRRYPGEIDYTGNGIAFPALRLGIEIGEDRERDPGTGEPIYGQELDGWKVLSFTVDELATPGMLTLALRQVAASYAVQEAEHGGQAE